MQDHTILKSQVRQFLTAVIDKDIKLEENGLIRLSYSNSWKNVTSYVNVSRIINNVRYKLVNRQSQFHNTIEKQLFLNSKVKSQKKMSSFKDIIIVFSNSVFSFKQSYSVSSKYCLQELKLQMNKFTDVHSMSVSNTRLVQDMHRRFVKPLYLKYGASVLPFCSQDYVKRSTCRDESQN